jgi:hypothetical protein
MLMLDDKSSGLHERYFEDKKDGKGIRTAAGSDPLLSRNTSQALPVRTPSVSNHSFAPFPNPKEIAALKGLASHNDIVLRGKFERCK